MQTRGSQYGWISPQTTPFLPILYLNYFQKQVPQGNYQNIAWLQWQYWKKGCHIQWLAAWKVWRPLSSDLFTSSDLKVVRNNQQHPESRNFCNWLVITFRAKSKCSCGLHIFDFVIVSQYGTKEYRRESKCSYSIFLHKYDQYSQCFPHELEILR